MYAFIRDIESFPIRNQHDIIHDWAFDTKFNVIFKKIKGPENFEEIAEALWVTFFFDMLSKRASNIVVADDRVFSIDPVVSGRICREACRLGISIICLKNDTFLVQKVKEVNSIISKKNKSDP